MSITREDWLSAKAVGYLFAVFMGDCDGQERLWKLAAHQPDLESVLHQVQDQVVLALTFAKGGGA